MENSKQPAETVAKTCGHPDTVVDEACQECVTGEPAQQPQEALPPLPSLPYKMYTRSDCELLMREYGRLCMKTAKQNNS